jgi:DNA-binding GntR family transcriptional regulator
MNLDSLDRLAPRTLKENVTEILRQLIIDGSLAPGTEFNQAQIAERLGISRGPIREALGQLEQEGLIENTPYKGVMVTQLTRRYVEELYSVRTALETLALTRFMERMTEADLERLHQIVAEMRRAARLENPMQLVELDLAFHEHILRAADHQLALKLWKVLEVGVRRCLHIRHKIYTFLDEVVGSHPTLVTAIEQGDQELAVRLLYEHVTESAAHILANLPPDIVLADLVSNGNGAGENDITH